MTSIVQFNDTLDNFIFPDSPVSSKCEQDECLIKSSSNNCSIINGSINQNKLHVSSGISFDDSSFFSTLDISRPAQSTPNNASKNGFQYALGSPQLSKDNLLSYCVHPSEENNTTPKRNVILEPTTDTDLSKWGLPQQIVKQYKHRKIEKMFSWQIECLSQRDIFNGHKNLIYSAPTSAGKTLVAEILAIRTILERRKKILFVLPFVSVVREKMYYFQDLFNSIGIRAEGYMGSYAPAGAIESIQLIVSTIEKANSIVNKMLLDDTITDLGMVIVDELHLLGDPHRGYILELLLTKLRFVCQKRNSTKIQIIGMSATLPNIQVLSEWLDAHLYITEYRPIPLFERVLIGDEIFDNCMKSIRKLESLDDVATDNDHVLQLCLETIETSCSVLIFCPTKAWCENLSVQLAIAFQQIGMGTNSLAIMLRNQLPSTPIIELIEQLKCSTAGLDETLRKTVSFGIAFHHAGLTMDERDIIEAGFRLGTIRILVATSTLSSGVNLPAKRVLIRTPIFHNQPLDVASYKQMAGRAGRMGKDVSGECILICRPCDVNLAETVLNSPLEPIQSCLAVSGKLTRTILEAIASGLVVNFHDVVLFTKCTLQQRQDADLEETIEKTLKFLVANEFIHENKSRDIEATSLGRACLSSSMAPEDGLALLVELEKARKCFVLESELHLVYLVTPYSCCQQWPRIDWMLYLEIWGKLPNNMRRIGELVGVKEALIALGTQNRLKSTPKNQHDILVLKRFYVALALNDLVNEHGINTVCSKFGCNRGVLQTLQLTAATFAGMVTAFSHQLGWTNVELLVAQFQNRLQFGVQRELLDLMRLPLLSGRTARVLFDAGFDTVIKLAHGTIKTISEALRKSSPFISTKTGLCEPEAKNLRYIWIPGKDGLTNPEAAEMILQDARNYLGDELGINNINWQTNVDEVQIDCNRENSTDMDYCFNRSNSNCSHHTSKSLFSHSSDKSSSLTKTQCTAFETPISRYISARQTNTESTKKRHGSSSILQDTPLRKNKKFSKEVKCVQVVEVTSENFNSVFEELHTQSVVSLSIGCEYNDIGKTSEVNTQFNFTYCRRKIVSFAIAWNGLQVYYFQLNAAKHFDILKTIASNEQILVRMFDSKEQLKTLMYCAQIEWINASRIRDPQIADWILDSEREAGSLEALVLSYCPNAHNILSTNGIEFKHKTSLGLATFSSISTIKRATVEGVLTFRLMGILERLLSEQSVNLYKTLGVEMAIAGTLCRMEFRGIRINRTILDQVSNTILEQKLILEKEAHILVGRRFSLSSPNQVASVFGLKRAGRKFLETCDSPLAKIIIIWRKIHSILVKTVQPLLKVIDAGRICSSSISHTATGRISMHEPNVQNVAKRFQIVNPRTLSTISINCREAFVAREGFCFLSADYCQLELRLMAHFSKDEALCAIMQEKCTDVFKAIAAKWNRIDIEAVNDEIRHKTKQICYGIIYGMGSKTLGQQLNISPNEAHELSEAFKNHYVGIKTLVANVIGECRRNGYVETMAGRRRYLPNITSTNGIKKCQAERQAINTTIQGSAADLVKSTMLALDSKFEQMINDRPHLILHLHDELLYEVPEGQLHTIACIMKSEMETCVQLSIPFPVKLKSGPCWGQMRDYNL